MEIESGIKIDKNLIGPNLMYEMFSEKYKKKIYLMSDIHIIKPFCKKQNDSIVIDDLLKEMTNFKNNKGELLKLDYFIELPYLDVDSKHVLISKKEINYIQKIYDSFYDCSIYNKNCPYKNLRVHYTDLRKYGLIDSITKIFVILNIIQHMSDTYEFTAFHLDESSKNFGIDETDLEAIRNNKPIKDYPIMKKFMEPNLYSSINWNSIIKFINYCKEIKEDTKINEEQKVELLVSKILENKDFTKKSLKDLIIKQLSDCEYEDVKIKLLNLYNDNINDLSIFFKSFKNKIELVDTFINSFLNNLTLRDITSYRNFTSIDLLNVLSEYKVYIAPMDIYLMARVFRKFDKLKTAFNGSPENIVIYAGDNHIQEYRKFLASLNFIEFTDKEIESTNFQCIDLHKYPPFFHNY